MVQSICSSLMAINHNWIPNSLIISTTIVIAGRWKVCLGVQYATTLWQVGNAAKNNVTLKVEFYCAKNEILVWKYERELTQSIVPTDINPLLNITFPIAFGWVDCNLSSVAERGWNPLNQVLLEHPRLKNAEISDGYDQHLSCSSTSGSIILSNTSNIVPDLNFTGIDGMVA